MTILEKPAGLDDTMDGLGLAAGAANIIMQLSWPQVGYGVFESRVESGRLFDHPLKRTRTTLTYLAVAARGTDDEKRLFRDGVNKAHAQVRSTAASPVKYNAFDHELQLWVAACIYRGFEDVPRQATRRRRAHWPIRDDPTSRAQSQRRQVHPGASTYRTPLRRRNRQTRRACAAVLQ